MDDNEETIPFNTPGIRFKRDSVIKSGDTGPSSLLVITNRPGNIKDALGMFIEFEDGGDVFRAQVRDVNSETKKLSVHFLDVDPDDPNSAESLEELDFKTVGMRWLKLN